MSNFTLNQGRMSHRFRLDQYMERRTDMADFTLAVGVRNTRILNPDTIDVRDVVMDEVNDALLRGATLIVGLAAADEFLGQLSERVDRSQLRFEEALVWGLEAHRVAVKVGRDLGRLAQFLTDLGLACTKREGSLYVRGYEVAVTIAIDDTGIRLDDRVVKETLFMLNHRFYGPRLVEVATPETAFHYMLAALSLRAQRTRKMNLDQVLRGLGGFSSSLGLDQIGRDLRDAETVAFTHEGLLGTTTLYLNEAGTAWASRKGVRGTRLVELVFDQLNGDYAGKGHFYMTDPNGKYVAKLTEEQLRSGDNALRVRLTDDGLTFGGNIKHAFKSMATFSKEVTFDLAFSNTDSLSMSGAVYAPSSYIREVFQSTRELIVGGTVAITNQSDEEDVEALAHCHDQAVFLVAEGDIVSHQQLLMTIRDKEFRAVLKGAEEALVTKLVRHYDDLAQAITVEVHLDVYDVGIMKLRRAMKAILQSTEAGGVLCLVDGQPWHGVVAGQGVNKNAFRFQEGLTERRSATVTVCRRLDADTYARMKEIHAFLQEAGQAPEMMFDDSLLTVTTIDPNGVVAKMTAVVERSHTQENVGRTNMTVPEMSFISCLPSAGAWLAEALTSDVGERLDTLAYLLTLAAKTDYDHDVEGVPRIQLGVDQLPLSGKTQQELLANLAASYPDGVMLLGVRNKLYLRGDYLAKIVSEDALGSAYVGLGNLMSRLLRIAVDPARRFYRSKEGIKEYNLDGMLYKLKLNFVELSQAKSSNKIYGQRFGVTAKVVPANWQRRNEVRIRPGGAVDRELKALTRRSDVSNMDALVLRHPAATFMLAQLVYDWAVDASVIQVNEMAWRRFGYGDFDGDAGCIFPILDPNTALAMRQELNVLIPDTDPLAVMLDTVAEDPVFEMFGELPNPSKADFHFDGKLNKRKSYTLNELREDLWGMADTISNRVGMTYRMMESATFLAALGFTSIHLPILGAALYEHDGLCGKPIESHTGQALDLFRRGMTSAYDLDKFVKNLETKYKAMGLTLKAPTTPTLIPNSLELAGFEPMAVASMLNRSLNRMIPEGTYLEDKFPFVELAPLYQFYWYLGRKRLHEALQLAPVVASMEMELTARTYGFHNHFLYKLLRQVAYGVAEVVASLGVPMMLPAGEESGALFDASDVELDFGGVDLAEEWGW